MTTRIACTLLSVLLLADLTTASAEPPSAAALRERYEREKAPVWTDGDTVTFFYRGKADQVTVMFGGDIRQLKPVAGSDMWTISAHLRGLQRGVFDYRLWATNKTPQA